jgi:16S rRNA (cytosine1402-N4)-methyltransferase
MPFHHIPVMPVETIDYLNCTPGKIYVDCTLGGSGHARRICNKIKPGGILIGIDQDVDAIQHGQEVLKQEGVTIHLVNDNFSQLPAIFSRFGIQAVDGILLDLGLSLHQIEASGRGFSFSRDEPLDMRMDIGSKLRAEDIVNGESEAALTRLFKEYGEVHRARQIARKIVSQRKKQKICTSGQLAGTVLAAIPKKDRHKAKIHPATRVFMALRIAVNQELGRLQSFLNFAVDCLNPKGRLGIISFHSLEDRIVKQKFQELEKGCTCPPKFPECICGNKPTIKIITRKVVRPTQEEIDQNPMARSAKLRVMERL